MPAVPVEMKKSREQVEENEEEIINRSLQQQIYNTELHLLQIYSSQSMPNMMQQYSDTEKLHTKIEAQKNLIDKQEHNMELLPSSHSHEGA